MMEMNLLVKFIYDLMVGNQEVVDKLDCFSCQDMGVIQYFVEVGVNFLLLGELEEVLKEVIVEVICIGLLCYNVVEMFDEKNIGINMGMQIFWLDWCIVLGLDSCIIDVYMVGGGCILLGVVKVFMLGQGYEGVVEFVMDVIIECGVNVCLLFLVGVGVFIFVEIVVCLFKFVIMCFVDFKSENLCVVLMEELFE